MHEPLFYSFEGLDGAGKTTNVRNLKAYFDGKGKRVHTAFSPSKSLLGQFIRANFLEFDSWLKEHLFVLDLQHSCRSVPADVDVLLWDRYVDSIYTSNRESALENIASLTTKLPSPYRTFFLHIPPEIAWQRESTLSDHHLNFDWLKMKYERYQEVMSKYPGRLHVIDATRSLPLVFASLVEIIELDLANLNSL